VWVSRSEGWLVHSRCVDARAYDLFGDAVIIGDLEGRVVLWNRAAEALYGRTAAECVGRPLAEVAPCRPPRDHSVQVMERLARGEALASERLIERPDGATVAARLTEALHRDPAGAIAGVIGVIRPVAPVAANAAPGGDPVDEDASLLTARQERQHQDAERIAALATLAAGMAHELNNPLTSSLANVDGALERLDTASAELAPLREALIAARTGLVRIGDIVRSTSLLARDTSGRWELVDVNAAVEDSITLATATIRYRARLVRQLGPAGSVEGNAAQLAQAITNILVNAAAAVSMATAERNEIRIVTRRDGARVVIEVHDNGCGIPDELHARIFEPFFTTKGVGGGLGLGLPVSNGIVRSFGGTITVASKRREGSVFLIELPTAAAAPAPSPPAAALQTPAQAGRYRVLIVDDEPMVTTTLRRYLARDFDVVIVASGAAALAALAGPEPGFDAIVCDMMMPGMTGEELYGAVTRAHPHVARRFLFMTGGAFGPADRRFLDSVMAPLIEKPFDLAALRDLVRGHIERVAHQERRETAVSGEPGGRASSPADSAARARLTPERLVAQTLALSTLSGVLGASLDEAAAMRDVAGALAPAFADLCSVVLVDDADDRMWVAARVADGASDAVLRDLSGVALPSYLAERWRAILRAGRAMLVPDCAADFRANAPPGDRYAATIGRLGPSSALLAPLVSRRRSLGVLNFAMLARSGREFGAADLGFAEELGHRVGLAIDNARRYTQLRLGEERLQLALRTADVRVFSQDLELRYTLLAGRSDVHRADWAMGKTDFELFNPAVATRLTALKRGVLEAGDGAQDVLSISVDGVDRFYDVRVEPLREAAGGIAGVTGASWDVTEHRGLIARLEEAEDRARRLIDDAPEAYFLARADGRYVDVNTAACALLGYSRDELLTMSKVDLLLPEDLPRLAAISLEPQPGTVTVAEWRLRKKSGELIDVEINAKTLPGGKRQGFVRDITARKRAAREGERVLALARRQQRLLEAPRVRDALATTLRLVQGPLDSAGASARVEVDAHDLRELVDSVIDLLSAPVEPDIGADGRQSKLAHERFDPERVLSALCNLVAKQ